MVEIRSNLGCMAAHEMLNNAALILELAKLQLEKAAAFAASGHGLTMPGEQLAFHCEALALRVEELAGAVMGTDNPEVEG